MVACRKSYCSMVVCQLQILLLSVAATAFVSPHARTLAPASALHARTRAPASALRAVPAQDWTAGCETFTWEGHAIRYCKEGAGPPLVLLHGFGSSLETWRANAPALVDAGYSVYRLDFLGLGLSEKAPGPYSIERWARQVGAFLDDQSLDAPVLVGNSIGSLVALQVASERRVRGLLLNNCAGGMNSKFSGREPSFTPLQQAVAQVAFAVIDALLAQETLARFIFDRVRSPENVRQVLGNVYVDGDRVDATLVDSTLLPAEDPKALAVFVDILTGDPGPRPADLVERTDAPIHCFWGDADLLTPLDGPTGLLFRGLADAGRCSLTIAHAGHVPHDDAPAAANADYVAWLRTLA